MDVLLILLGVWIVLAAAFFVVVRALGFVADKADRASDEHAAQEWASVQRPPGRHRQRRARAVAVGASPTATAPRSGASVVACADCRLTIELPKGRAMLCPSCRKLLIPPARVAA